MARGDEDGADAQRPLTSLPARRGRRGNNAPAIPPPEAPAVVAAAPGVEEIALSTALAAPMVEETAPVEAPVLPVLETFPRLRRVPALLIWGVRGLLVAAGIGLAWSAQNMLIIARQLNPGLAQPPPEAWQRFALGAVLFTLGSALPPLAGIAGLN